MTSYLTISMGLDLSLAGLVARFSLLAEPFWVLPVETDQMIITLKPPLYEIVSDEPQLLFFTLEMHFHQLSQELYFFAGK